MGQFAWLGAEFGSMKLRRVFSNPGMSLKEEFAAGSFDGSLLE